MKKHIIKALALAAVVGVGAGVGAIALRGEAKEASASVGAGDKLYVKLSEGWYTDYSSYSKPAWAHIWSDGHDATDVKLSLVSDDEKLFSVDLPTYCDKVIITQGTDSAIGWTNQSDNLTLSSILTGGNNVIMQKADVWKFTVDYGSEYRPNLTAGDGYLRGSWSGGWGSFDHPMTKTGNVYSIEGVTLTNGSQVKVTSVGSNYFMQWYDASDLTGDTEAASFDGTNVVISKDGLFDISVDTSTKIYTINFAEDTDLTLATTFAEEFKTSMAKYCPVHGTDVEKGRTKLVEEWAEFKKAYNGTSSVYTNLTETARGYLKTTADGGTLDEFRQRYANIIQDYYSILYADYNFLAMNGLVPRGANSVQLYASEFTFPTAIVITIASVSVVAAAAYIFLKRRKQD